MRPLLFLKIIIGLFLLLAVAVWLTSINHPIVLKLVSGSARHIGKPVNATVYTNGQLNKNTKVFHSGKYWGSSKQANNYLVHFAELDSFSLRTFLNINLKEGWIGIPAGNGKDAYDLIAGHLFQSETGGHFTPLEDRIQGFDFDPQLSFTGLEIKFKVPANRFGFDSVRIEFQKSL